MPCATHRNLDPSTPRRRSPRLKNKHVVYGEDSETDFSTLKHVKTEIIDLGEIASPSTSVLHLASIGGNDDEHDFHDVSLKDLRARCKAKNWKAQKFSSEGPGTTNHTQCGNLENEKPKEEVDLDEPLLSLKQKRQKTTPSKANRKMDAPTCSPHAPDTASKRDNTSPVQASPLEATLHDSTTEKLKRRATDLEHSKIAIDHTEEIVGENISCAETENAGVLTSSGSPDTFCKIKTDYIDMYIDEEVGVSSYGKNFTEHSSVELLQVPIEDDGCGQQPGFITQPTELDDVSTYSCELTHNVEAYSLLSSLDFIDEVSNHQKPSDHITNSDVDKSSVGNEYLVCCVNQSCDDHVDNDEYWYPRVVQGSPESVKSLEESSPIDEFNTEMGSALVVMQSDLCGSTERTCASLEEVVQMQAEGQFDSLVCHDVRPKDILLHMDVEQAATGYNFAFDKTLDLAQATNFVTQDGQLESIVYDALNNHVQRKNSENKTFVGVPDTAVIPSPPVHGFTANCPNEANASHDGEILFANDMKWSPKDISQLNATMDGDICKSVNDQGPREQFVFQPQLLQDCVDMDKACGVTSESSSSPEETQEMPAGVLNSTATSLEIDGQPKNSELFIDEGSTEEHAPKKLLSNRKIMSPTSQEKLCSALTGIALCGVQRLKRKVLEDCDRIRRTLPKIENKQDLPKIENKQDQSLLSTDKTRKGRTSLSPTSKGILKSTESSSPQRTTCSCMRSSSVLLDTEKAVEFSQRQMHDIENIAAKLIRSLKHMKSIVDESLSSEAHSLLPNFNTVEIRAASEDALEVERTTRKWLTIMNKDCNRFCKILTLAGKKAVSRPQVLRKRKISFADEAGGTLCHVKVFNDGQTSLLSECQREF